MHLIFWGITGIAASFLMRRVIPGEGPRGVVGDLTLGAISALAGGWLFETFLGHSYGNWSESLLVAFIAAVVAFLAQRSVVGKRDHLEGIGP